MRSEDVDTWRSDPTKTFYFGLALGSGLTLVVLALMLSLVWST
jgi:hypothetical protein